MERIKIASRNLKCDKLSIVPVSALSVCRVCSKIIFPAFALGTLIRSTPWHRPCQVPSKVLEEESISRVFAPRVSFAIACRTAPRFAHDLRCLTRLSSRLDDLRVVHTATRILSDRPSTLAVASRSGWPSTWNCRGCSAGETRVLSS